MDRRLWYVLDTVGERPGEKGLDGTAGTLSLLGIASPPDEPSAAPGPTASARLPQITTVSLTYEQIVDALLLSPPTETQGQLAKRLGYSQSYLSRLIASDAFQVRLADRIEKSIEPERQAAFKLRFASIEEEARGILKNSLRLLAEKLDQPDPDLIPAQLIIKSAEMTSKLLGYGARDLPGTPQRVDMHLHLHQLRDNLRNLNQSPDVSDAEIVVKSAASGAAGG